MNKKHAKGTRTIIDLIESQIIKDVMEAEFQIAEEQCIELKWSCFLGQVSGFAKMHRFSDHAAFRISAWSKYAAFGVRLSRAL